MHSALGYTEKLISKIKQNREHNGDYNSIFGNNELNDKIQELENSNLEMQKTIANLEIEKAKLESKLTPEMLDLESLQNRFLNHK